MIENVVFLSTSTYPFLAVLTVLSCTAVLFGAVLFCPALSCTILPYPVVSCTVLTALHGAVLLYAFCRPRGPQLRTVCYNLLGLACKQGALYLSIPPNKVQDVVVGGLLAGVEYIENR